MRHLLQPVILGRSICAAAITATACYPRLSMWPTKFPVWYLIVTLFACSIILWGFVLAWHTTYTRRPIFFAKCAAREVFLITLAGVILALACRLWLDPALKKSLPEDYPADFANWLATLPFLFAFGQLFLTFAPFDWLMRLCRKVWIAAVLTAVFGVCVTMLRLDAHGVLLQPTVLAGLLAGRFIGGLLAVILYVRGGICLAWWWAFLFELRLLPELL